MIENSEWKRAKAYIKELLINYYENIVMVTTKDNKRELIVTLADSEQRAETVKNLECVR